MLVRLLHIFRRRRQKWVWLSPWRPRRFGATRRPSFGPIGRQETLERRLALSATEQFPWVGDSAATADRAAHVWTVVDGAEWLSDASSRRLSEAIALGSPRLVDAITAPSFGAVAARVFGAAGESAALSGLRAEVSASGFSLRVQVVGGGVLGTARAAYASSDDLPAERIYVSADWLAAADRSEIETVLIEETGQRLERSIAHLDRALAHLAEADTRAILDRQAELVRQADSLRLFRHLTFSRLYHLRASQLAAKLRATPSAELAGSLEACLRADLRNAGDLLALVQAGEYQGFDVATLKKTFGEMASEFETYCKQPESWVQTHLLD